MKLFISGFSPSKRARTTVILGLFVHSSIANVIPPRRDMSLGLRDPAFRAPDFNRAALANRDFPERDIPYLNLALTIEHLQDALYKHGLHRYSDQDFKSAGYMDWARGRLEQISEHERVHVEFLKSAVASAGVEPVKPCEYTFNDLDPASFIMMSEAVEAVGTAMYTGLTQYFSGKSYVTALSSVLATEARHASWLYSVLLKGNPWSTPFEAGLTPNQAHTLTTAFTTPESCPQTNSALLPSDLHAYPLLSLPTRIVPGQEAELLFTLSESLDDGKERLYAAFMYGAVSVFTRVSERDADGGEKKYFAQIPRDLRAQGVVFVMVLKGGLKMSEVRMDDGGVIAGPALIMFPFDGHGNPAM